MTVATGAGSVTPPAAPEATPPNPPAAPPSTPTPAAQSDDPAALKAKLELVQRDRAEQGEKNAKLAEQLTQTQRQLDELNKRLLSGKTKQLEEQGHYQQLWEDAKQTIQVKEDRITELEAELATTRNSVAAERLRSAALSSIRKADAISPEQMFALLQPNLREVGGKPVVLNGGVEQPLETYLSNLRSPGSGYEHHFSPTGRSGMGTNPTPSPTIAPGLENPWKTGNITQQLILVAQNPELAQALQAEASKG
jgi:hypothetical protein